MIKNSRTVNLQPHSYERWIHPRYCTSSTFSNVGRNKAILAHIVTVGDAVAEGCDISAGDTLIICAEEIFNPELTPWALGFNPEGGTGTYKIGASHHFADDKDAMNIIGIEKSFLSELEGGSHHE